MAYFEKFDQTVYNGSPVTNILTAVLPSRLNIDRSFVYQRYTITDADTPESVADKLYGDPELYWTIFVVNAIIDPFTDWPIRDAVIEEYVTKKYGSLNGVNHFRDNRTGRQVDDLDDKNFRLVPPSTLPFYIVPVTHFETEKELNDAKRDILVIIPGFVNNFVETYGRSLEGTL